MTYEVGQIRSLHIRVNGNFVDLKRVWECEKLYFWQALNCEKPSRQYFLLNKGALKRNSLKSVQKPDGRGSRLDFNSESERQIYINNFYKELYINATPDSMSICDFLRNEIYNS